MLKFWYETITASNQKCLLGCILFSFHGERKPEGTTHKTLGMDFDKRMITCILIHHCKIIQNHFTALKNPLCSICSSLPNPWQTLDLFTQ